MFPESVTLFESYGRVWFFMTPIPWSEVGFAWNRQPAEIGNIYGSGLLMLLVAAALLVWEVVDRVRGRPSR